MREEKSLVDLNSVNGAPMQWASGEQGVYVDRVDPFGPFGSG